MSAQQVTPKAPLASARDSSPEPAGSLEGSVLPSEQTARQYPLAHAMPSDSEAADVNIVADTQTARGGHYTLDGSVILTYGDRTVQADHIEYDRNTGDLMASGHLLVLGGNNHERIEASHGTVNLKSQTGRFYDVKGSVGIRQVGRRTTFINANPFLFTGRLVVKTGPQNYDVYEGSVTSCQLPHPDWILAASHFSLDGERATARNSVFRLLNLPLFFLPYVTHSVDGDARQTGLLIPVLGQSSTKGFIIGEQIYFAINRSTDLTVGAEYFSSRGYAQSASFRYRGRGDDFARASYSGLLDRRTGTGNQGGEDVLFTGRHDFNVHNRVVADAEYLSSFTYRAAFTENFNQAVSSSVTTKVYGMHQQDGFELSARADRFQVLQRTPSVSATGVITPGEQVRIFHVPSLDLSSVDRALGHSGFTFSFAASGAGLKRVQPNFQTGGIVERFDFHPELGYRIDVGNWHLRPSVAVRDTYYSRSRIQPGDGSSSPTESGAGLNRSDLEIQVDGRAPVLERTFSSGLLHRVFGTDFKHTIEPAFTYRYVTGISNFERILRFDDRDIVSNTNEIEYGVTQRLFLKPRSADDCPLLSDADVQAFNALSGSLPGGVAGTPGDASLPTSGCGTRERISWRLTQKYFFDPSFGGAIQTGRRNLFDTTLDLSGIAFLTEQRKISPLVSRLRVRPSNNFDFEWDVDYDTGAKKFNASNIFVDVHQGATFAGFSYARLNAPGRAYSEGIPSSTSNFSQMRVLLGYGMPAKLGLSLAANAGLDLNVGSVQYAALQTSYNWNCCGFSAEYRKYELGSVRNENAYRFNFTLANVGTAGNLKRAERLF